MTGSLPKTTDDALLNRRSYLVRTRFDPERKIDSYEITDPETGAPLARAAELTPGRLARVLRAFFGRNLLLTQVGVYQAVSGHRVFSIHEPPGLWSACILVRDAAGNRMCLLHGRFAFIGGGFLIRDSRGQVLGRLEAEHEGAPYQFTARDGRRIGAILERADGEARPPAQWVDRYAVVLDDAAEGGEVASILLLASALALDIVYRERV